MEEANGPVADDGACDRLVLSGLSSSHDLSSFAVERLSLQELQVPLFKIALDAASSAVAICACSTDVPIIIYSNPAFEVLTGYTVEAVRGWPYDFLFAGDSSRAAPAVLQEAISAGQPATMLVDCIRRDGTAFGAELVASPMHANGGEVTHYVITLREANAADRHLAQLERFVRHDDLTGLPNRRLLLERVEGALDRYRRYGETFALAFVDIDDFKEINDAFGHAVGDELLKGVAECLTAGVRPCDTAARLSGDEFIILFTDTDAEETVSRMAARIGELLSGTVVLAGVHFQLSCSIGIALCPRDGTSAAELLKKADGAMYRDKRLGRSRLRGPRLGLVDHLARTRGAPLHGR